MSFNKLILASGLLAMTLVFTACSSSAGPAPYKPLDLSNRTESFKQGARDGCDTADGDYTKNHDAFNNDFEYHDGWFAGRRNCQGRPR
ncbi:MAG: hypothetical protein U9Q90_09065 [Campylobacterota bacterium]|nr:hypothetical protein [Campylobacterota bacterium]